MTREEAIQEFQNCKGLIQQDGQDYLDERDIPLLDMAIEALSVANLKEEFESAEYEDYEHATLVDIKEPLKVSVVRCKDCIHWDTDSHCDSYRRAEDFCSWGERREE